MRTVEREGPAPPEKPGGKTPEGWDAYEWRQRYRRQRRQWRRQRERAQQAREQKRLGLEGGMTSLYEAMLASPDIPEQVKRELTGDMRGRRARRGPEQER